MPAGGTAEQPRLHVVSLPSGSIDWPRTEQYAAAARYQRYAETLGEQDFQRLGSDFDFRVAGARFAGQEVAMHRKEGRVERGEERKDGETGGRAVVIHFGRQLIVCREARSGAGKEAATVTANSAKWVMWRSRSCGFLVALTSCRSVVAGCYSDGAKSGQIAKSFGNVVPCPPSRLRKIAQL
jgi:hypothetical protein